MDDIFGDLSKTFASQDATREKLRDRRDAADGPIRAAQRSLAQIHSAPDLAPATGAIRAALLETGPLVRSIEHALPAEPGAFHRYADMWRSQLQTLSTIAVVVQFIESDALAGLKGVMGMLGADVRLPVEDYLVGVCNAMPELARLSMNRVIRNDYETPNRCARFAHSVSEGFKQLNLRNDFLRKRYDGIKYDVKRMEEIMYDLSIRGLVKKDGEREMDVSMAKQEDANMAKGEDADSQMK